MIDLANKKVLLVGFGGEGRANLRYAASRGAQSIAISDQTPLSDISSDDRKLVEQIFTGETWLESAHTYDIIMRSPGVPLHLLEPVIKRSPQITVTSSTDIFLSKHRDRTIAITGTKGKSTTTSLLHRILCAAGHDAHIGGNIGIAAISLIDTSAAIYVLELSSYQLEDIRHSPHQAILLNLYPEHLDHHGDFERYAAAKARIATNQQPGDLLILPEETHTLSSSTNHSPATRSYFSGPNAQAWIEDDTYFYHDIHGRKVSVCSVSGTKLKGPGNRQNILAVLTALRVFSIPTPILAETISNFDPLPHRLEEVGIAFGVRYINDSISTVPEACLNALETFGNDVKTIILGGYDRGVSFENLARYILSSSVENVILFPPSGARIEATITQLSAATGAREISFTHVQSMPEAITAASHVTPQGSTCLLSPASPSFPIFKNFEERGQIFRECVRKLAGGG
jgi:UDP-N-acetylmuramoylalanine--D-glutamate ligase